ncbi:MAG: response regulator [Solirubrobacterales bacterium]|nr:response regulator [Solirubrobacterales bacterium]
MPRPSLARSLPLALIGLTLVLAVIAAFGVASLYNSRQNYENTLTSSYQLDSAASNLATATVVFQSLSNGSNSQSELQAARTYRSAQNRARALAQQDPQSVPLVNQEAGAANANAALSAMGKVQDRQTQRQTDAQHHARNSSQLALALIVIAGAIALLVALGMVLMLIRSMRRPLDSLVDATRAMAGGDLHRRVEPDGPAELRHLSSAFNAMGDDLEAKTQRIEQERSRLASTITSLGEALLVTEPGSTRLATLNPRAADLVPELAVGHDLEHDPGPLPPLSQLSQTEQTVEHNGRTLAVTGNPLDPQGKEGTVVTVRDMSEWARLDRAKSEFIATASHELRSPLTSLKGFVELLANSPRGLNERQREFVAIILRSTDRLVDLVNDLLDVARIEADHVEINRRAVDTAEIVDEMVELMGPRIEAKHQTLTTEVAPSLPLALADPARLRQIVANLLTNAHTYTPDGGKLLIRTDTRDDQVRISVADTGPGMSTEQLDHIYERFYRAQDDHTSAGTGLGLSIVKSLVDLHRGKIEVASQPGRGTTFRVSIPAAGSSVADVNPALDALRGRRVLIIEDEPEIAQLISDQLAPLEVETTIAPMAKQGLELVRKQKFDAVTLDVRMPEMDGVEVLKEIRATHGLEHLPVVFVSVFSNMAELAGEWIISKPIDAQELREVLGTAISMGRTSALVVSRPEMRKQLEPSLRALGVELVWAGDSNAAEKACAEQRFELALVDAGLPKPQQVVRSVNLRGRRLRRAVVLFNESGKPESRAVEELGLKLVSVSEAAQSLADALQPAVTRTGEPATASR